MFVTDNVLWRTRFALKRLTLFREIGRRANIFAVFEDLLAELLEPEGNWQNALKLHHDLVGKLLEHSMETPFIPVGSVWQDYILDNILLAENDFTRQVVQSEGKELPNIVLKAAEADLLALQALYNLDAASFTEALEEVLAGTGAEDTLDSWSMLPWEKLDVPEPEGPGYSIQLKQSFQSGVNWDKLLEPLIFYYRTVGTGSFSYCHAFRFLDNDSGPLLKPIMKPDPIRLSNLIGYEAQRQQVVSNTEQFINGFSANNLLLYGERGTGKSSTIKALVHEYGERGLRMVEMAKQDLGKLPVLLDLIRHRPHRFIIFIDDLSFEEGEVDYKHLKAVLEGSLEARPRNVLIYATSNRRHLIKERFSDREFTGDDEVRAQDTLQEKLSLSDRFGITITFTSPDQEEYLAIVEGLARQEGMDVDPGDLRAQALRWALWHNGRSGRTARQFIDDLKGRLEYESR
jgi:predicted AAA+ superfamily ATPase